jgi:hypothetical protein
MEAKNRQEANAQDQLPTIEARDCYEFTIKYRPLFEGKKNILEFLPMMEKPYRDDAPNQMIVWARQTGKTSLKANRLAYKAVSKNNSWQVYVTYEDESLRTFVNTKYRFSVYQGKDNFLAKFVNGKTLGSLHHMDFLNGARQDFVTHAHEFTHVEGKSADDLELDEHQYLNMAAYARLNESQAWTQGSTHFGGIGGYIGTKHHKQWLETNQQEWVYDNPDWRDNLKFLGYNVQLLLPDEFTVGRNRLVYGNYLKHVLSGKWVSQANHNSTIQGYHLSQEQMPHIPRTEKEAMELYRISIKQSLEWKKKDYSYEDYMRHVLGKFVKGSAKPFLREDIEKLFDRTQALIPADQVDHGLGDVLAGIDLGGGNKAYTIIWIAQRVHADAPVFKTLYLRRIKKADVEAQADMLINLIDAYQVDQVVCDAGGGTRQVQKLEQEYGARCIKVNYLDRPENPLPKESEIDNLRYENRYIIDRTFGIDQVRDLFTRYFTQNNNTFPRMIIPFFTKLPGFTDDNNDWIIKDFEAVEGVMQMRKGRERMIYEHDEAEPDDAVHAAVYLFIAHLIKNPSSTWFKQF